MHELISEHVIVTGIVLILAVSAFVAVASYWASLRVAKIFLPSMSRWLAMLLSFVWNIASFYILSILVWAIFTFSESDLHFYEPYVQISNAILSRFLGFSFFLFLIVESVILIIRVYRFPVGQRVPWRRALWRCVWPLGAIVLCLFIIGVALDVPASNLQDKTATAIQYIQSQKITLNDVDGTNLPPQPYEPENDATVAGVDKNNNGIRDDVELAIFAKYPNSEKIRAAELQYAMTEQMFLTQVFNTDTWKAVAEEDARAYTCALSVISYDESVQLQNLVFNTQTRQTAEQKAFEFTTSHGSTSGNACDIDLSLLSN